VNGETAGQAIFLLKNYQNKINKSINQEIPDKFMKMEEKFIQNNKNLKNMEKNTEE
jgi:hypothetical protein